MKKVDAMEATFVNRPPAGQNRHYAMNQGELQPQRLGRLPLGAVQPHGWLRHQLDLMVEGMVGRLDEVSRFLSDDNGWLGGDNPGWEEQAYWFRGLHDLAVLTGDARLLATSQRWIEAILASQDEDGYFGARYHKAIASDAPLTARDVWPTTLEEVEQRGHRPPPGQPGQVAVDLWPHMVMLDALISHYEHSTDPRVIPFMTRFFQFCAAIPDAQLMPDRRQGAFGDWKVYVQVDRAGDMLPHLYWLYNQTQDERLLDLADRFYEAIAPATDEWLDHHVVNFAQRFRYPGSYYECTGDTGLLDRSEYYYQQFCGTWGQQPRGIYGADENIRPGKVDPRQAIETCAMVELAKSFYILGESTGEARYADRVEDVLLNHFPPSQTPDLKALHYLTASNQPQLDSSTAHDYQNKGRQIDYSPWLYRCCQHNVAMGWPWYARHLWQASADDGLVAWLYGASTVQARVVEGVAVRIEEQTDYPFDGTVRLTLHCEQPAQFPLYLRLPGWCAAPEVALNGEPLALAAQPDAYLRLERCWQEGDQVTLHLPMRLGLTRWPRNGAVSVDRGPLSYSLAIGERWQRCGGSDQWPEWEVLPTTPWNYGLAVDPDDVAATIRVVQQAPPADQPWTAENAPIVLEARGQRIAGWGLTDATVDPLQDGPIACDAVEERITLIPLGCARLRIGVFPLIGSGPGAREWK